MHRLQRDPLLEPTCLRENRASGNNWYNLPGDCKRAVRLALSELQSSLCVYCERFVNLDKQNSYHVEHLVPQSTDMKQTLEWDNLALSCQSTCSCGNYKDNKHLSALPQDFREAYPMLVLMDGSIVPWNENDAILSDVIEELNLNNELLCNLRYNLYQALEALEPPDSLSDPQRELLLSTFWSIRGVNPELPTTVRSAVPSLASD